MNIVVRRALRTCAAFRGAQIPEMFCRARRHELDSYSSAIKAVLKMRSVSLNNTIFKATSVSHSSANSAGLYGGKVLKSFHSIRR